MKTTRLSSPNPKHAEETIVKHLNRGALSVNVKSALTTVGISQYGDFYKVSVNGGAPQQIDVTDGLSGCLELLKGDIRVTATYAN